MGKASAHQETDVEAALATTAPVTLDFRALFDAHVDYVAASLARLGVAEVDRDDLVSEVFVRVHRGLPAYDPSRPLRPWLFGFAMRVASEHRRLARHRREVVTAAIEAPSTEQRPDEALEEDESRRIVHTALAEIDLDKRAVLVLHDLDDTPIPAIAEALGIAEGTAYSRLRAARAELVAAVRRLDNAKGRS
jgi:RNA polymerase sigma-70 factor (ECF subfamily)